MMIPYGIYDPEANHGFVVVGTQRETPGFAVDAILLWWNSCGSHMYSGATELLVNHILPLECGGIDAPSNMQWQTVQEAKIKDRTERNCRRE